MTRTPPKIEQPPGPDPAIFRSLDAFRGHCGEPSLPIERCPICSAIPDRCYRQTISSLVADYDVDYGDEGYTNTVPSQVSQLEMFVNGPKIDSYQGEALLRCPTCHRLYYGKSKMEHVGARTYSTTSYQRVDIDTIYRSRWCVGWRVPDRDIDAVHPNSYLAHHALVRFPGARTWFLLDDNNQLTELAERGSESLQLAITDEECALWRSAVASPAVPGALHKYADWLLTHAPVRGRFLHQRLHENDRDWKLSTLHGEEKAWMTALGVERICENMFIGPLPRSLNIDATHLAALEPLLDQLPFLELCLVFDTMGLDDITRTFAHPVMAKVRSLSFRAHWDRIDPEESGVALMRTHFGDLVLAALCASPNVAQLEELRLNDIGSTCAALVASGPFVNLRRLTIHDEPIGDDGAAALARSRVVATLRYLRLSNCQIGDAGARALASSPHLANLEKLDVTANRFGPDGVAAFAAMRLVSL
ncbi:MAG: hypothetical protein H0T46_09105 [Deltaproteobacteria bacterium]|nr:hypothetical protein [Deltaproteobacteria bacterium]